MSIPHLPQVRIALWETLEAAGGAGKSQDIIEDLVKRFRISPAEREMRDPSGNKTFDHRIHSAIAQSRKIGWIESVEEGGYGFWKLTGFYYEDNPQL